MSNSELETLRTERDLLRKVVDNVTAMLAYWDSDCRCRLANAAYQQWFGVSPESLIGKHISELLGPLYTLNLPYIEGALRGEFQEFEREIPNPSGGPSRYSLAQYIPDVVDGAVRGFFVLVTDVSKLKKTEEALRESDAKFSRIISISPDAIIGVDEDFRISIFNDGAVAIFGYTREEAIGAPLDLLLPARLRDRHRRHMELFAAGETVARPMGSRSANIVGLRKNGEEFPAEAAISKLESEGKQLLTVALRDITEHKRIEREQEVLAEAGAVLALSLDYDQTLTSIAQLSVRHIAEFCVVDMLGEAGKVRRVTVVHSDPAKASICRRLAGLSLEREHTMAGTALATQRPQLLSSVGPEYWEAKAQNQEHLQLARELAPRSIMVAPLISTTGIMGALVFGSSTPGRYGPRDLALAIELAHRAALAIENAQLYAAAQHATQARDDVLGVVAHDVRNPLGSIQVAATLLQRLLEEAGSTKGLKHVENILRSTQRANRLIQDLLDVTRLEAGALSIAREAQSVTEIVVEAVESQRLLAAAASIELHIDVRPQVPELWADRDRLLQVLENLIGNAIKFTTAGGQVTIGVAPRADEVLFWVADTGGGIPPEHIPHVFDRFWQAKKAERRGAGLGLPICKGIVEAHSGRIWVESVEGRGSTFYFTIPCTSLAAHRTDAPASSPTSH